MTENPRSSRPSRNFATPRVGSLGASRFAPDLSTTPIPRYERGVDGFWDMCQWLDRAPKGRNETGVRWRRHDEYDKR